MSNIPISVYILLLANGTYYTGLTNNIERRLKEHQAGRSKSTMYFRPVRMIYKTKCFDRQAARRLEVKIKNRGARRYLLALKFK